MGHKFKGKRQGSIIYSMNQENKVSKIILLYLYCVSGGFGNDFYSHRMDSYIHTLLHSSSLGALPPYMNIKYEISQFEVIDSDS